MHPTALQYPVVLSIVLFSLQLHATPDTTVAPAWMHQAVIYGIKPSSFVKDAHYDDITQKIPELKSLGINTIWLQPVFKTARGGQGYDVTDFFALREDLGTADQLKHLIQTAKSNGIRTLFDFVPNHTSTAHPWAQDVIRKGKASAYYNYYQHQNDHAPYSSFYHTDSSGFLFYFWKDLVNLNYDNDTVQRLIIDACTYWIKEYGIDGYRFDAVWAVNARSPTFGRRLRDSLRAVKPDVLMLAEDKGNSDEVYEKGFDAAYDWTADTAWVSQWPWQYEHHAGSTPTIFNHPDLAKRKYFLERSLFSNKENNTRVLRFMENNDLARFIAGHSLPQTKMAAGIMFSMPGIPMLFCGQEIGFTGHPYSRKTVFDSGRSIRQQDSLGLFDFYSLLIKTRATNEALRSSAIEEIPVDAKGIIAYTRTHGSEEIIVIANLDSLPARVVLPEHYRKKDMFDLISEKKINSKNKSGILLDGFGILWLSQSLRK